MQGDSLQADWLSGKFGMCHNSIRGEQTLPKLENSALIQKSKIIKFNYCRAMPVLHSSALGFSDLQECELQTYIHRYTDTQIHTYTKQLPYMPLAHAHRGINKTLMC